jgi:uncharacterized protein YkwD
MRRVAPADPFQVCGGWNSLGSKHVLVAIAVVAVVAQLGIGGTPARASANDNSDIESKILALVNQARTQQGLEVYQAHAGLKPPARQHDVDMSNEDQLNHDGFQGRLQNAAPDPAQGHGAPDDGFMDNGMAGCENVAYYYKYDNTDTDDQVAQEFYDLWLNSPPHKECLFDDWGYGLNVAGVGVYLDSSGKWWATMEVARDYTPPAGGPMPSPTASQSGSSSPAPAPAAPAPTPAPTPRPTVRTTARPAARPVAPPAAVVAPKATLAPTPVPTPASTPPPCSFDWWVLRVDRCQ